MVNPTKTNFYLLFSLLAVITLIFFVSASHIIRTSTGGTSYNVSEDLGFVYNITVNNTEAGPGANITELDITLPEGFLFIPGASNVTDALGTFSNNSASNQLLNWSNSSAAGLISEGTNRTFRFNATASTPGNYNITIRTLNATGAYYANISVVVNDTTSPSAVQYVAPGETTNNANISRTNIAINVSVTDNGVINMVNISLFNSTLALINTSTNSTLIANSKSLFVNFTGLPQGVYYFNVTVNDTWGNINSTAGTRTVRIDTTAPAITLISPDDGTSSTTNAYNYTFNVTDTGSTAQSCSLIVNNKNKSTISAPGVNSTGGTNGIYFSFTSEEGFDYSANNTYVWSINCTDHASNVANSTSRTLTVLASTTATASSSSSGSSGVGLTYTTTTKQLAEGYKINRVKANYQIKLDLKGEKHTLKINSVTADEVTFTISSTPQSATLRTGETGKYDINNDGYYDLMVYVQSTNKVSGASLTIKSITEYEAVPVAPSAQGEIEEQQNAPAQNDETDYSSQTINKGMSIIAWIIIAVIIACVIGIILMKATKKSLTAYKPKR